MAFPAEVAQKLADAVAEAGIAPETLFDRAGVEARTPLSYADLCALYEAGARATGNDAFGLYVGERTRPDMYGLLGYAASHSPSVGEALERLVTLQGVWTQSVSLKLRREGPFARLAYCASNPPPAEDRRHETEQMLAALVAFVRTGTAAAVTPAEVRFEHPAPHNPAEHRRTFGCPVVFRAAATEILFHAADLRLPMAGADPKLGALLSAQGVKALAREAAGAPVAQAVRAELHQSMAAGRQPSLAAVARALGMGPRTLQRRLVADGLGWRDLVAEERIARARELLTDRRLGLAQIAHRAGFSQVSAFHRAFRRITGTTPRRHRLNLAAAEQRR
jgi:AraC-like DNA-binding protein